MAHNIFLDFLNRDSREIYGLFNNTDKATHLSLLVEAINVAVFLCREYCVVPPGFLAECDIARGAVSYHSDYLEERLIRWPLRETTFDQYFSKKQKQYEPFQERYHGLFDADARNFFLAFPGAIINRDTRIGDELLDKWEKGPDVEGVWRRVISRSDIASDIETIRSAPRDIWQEDTALTWTAIKERLRKSLGDVPSFLRHVLQHQYFSLYLDEYNLRRVENLPFERYNFFLESDDLVYDYRALRNTLKAADCWELISKMSAASMISLRVKYGYRDFRSAYEKLGRKLGNPSQFTDVISAVCHEYKDDLEKLNVESVPDKPIIVRTSGYDVSGSGLEKLSQRLKIVSSGISKFMEKSLSGIEGSYPPQSFATVSDMGYGSTSAVFDNYITLFCALEMEREILVSAWELDSCHGGDYWCGNVGGVDVLLYGPRRMGRVPAAISTMQLLRRVNPKKIIVAGIAGGFETADVSLGDILIANQVADLAHRKVREEEEGILREFRPRPFHINEDLEDFVNSSTFYDFRADWEQQTIERAGWPNGRRPDVHIGTVASLDEVVSSEEWIDELRSVWPGLLGVEMEAGGVCAAAAEENIPFEVIRGVSDHADPAKSDDEWRKIAMKTVVSLLEVYLERVAV